jgi:hypothetical protein
MMAQQISQSLPKQMEAWPELKGAYRFLNNPRVSPSAIGAAHRTWTARQCQGRSVVLCVQDDTEIHGVRAAGGRGGDDGEVLHSTLAVTPEGQLLGILDQRWFVHLTPVAGETRGQRAQRWRESDVWAEALAGVEAEGPGASRLIHVADRAADNMRFMHDCLKAQRGFVVRAQHDRWVEDGTGKLWEHMGGQAAAGTLTAQIGQQRDSTGRVTRVGREAALEVRYATVRLDPPQNHVDNLEGLTVQVVYLREENPPVGVEAVDWMLLTSEPVESLADALVITGYYQKRWVIEEWHRALKEGCRLEQSQVQTVEALRRLSALLSVLAVRLLQLRDLAQGREQANAEALRAQVDGLCIEVVATLAGRDPGTLTPREFWGVIIRQGGFIGRKSDGQPGWKVIWRGCHDISQMVCYAEALRDRQKVRQNCG